MPVPIFSPHPPSRRERGFALLITITLLAFMVLLLVSVASLTRVETQVAANSQKLSHARENALMALNIALGRLQVAAGPDQRVTARADLGTTGNAGGANGLVVPRDGSRHWTGVWANADAPANLFAQSPSPRLLTWLVSGNEAGPAFAADSAGKLITVPAPADIPFAPDDLSGPLSAATALASGATFTGNRGAQLLVGPATAAAPADYVAAPLMEINASNVPGVGAAMIGRYAWWIGDEGVKAKYNLLDPYHGNLDTATAPGRYRALAAQRNGIERMSDFATYAAGNANLPRVLNPSQIPVADPLVNSTAIAGRFHDLTTHSFGLLADSRAGGLKRDLTFHMEKGGLAGKVVPGPPAADSPHSWATLWNDLIGPRWEFLRSFYQLADSASPFVARRTLNARSTDAGAAVYGVFPVVVQVRFFATLHVGDAGDIRTRLRPLVILGNPYSVPIAMDGFDYYLSNGGGMRMRLYLDGANPPKLDYDIRTCLPGAVFRCATSLTFAPGELKVFTLEANVPVSSATSAFSPTLIEGVDPSTYIEYTHAQTIAAADKARRWTMLVNSAGQMTFNLCMQGGGTSAGQRYLAIIETGVLGKSFTEQRPLSNQVPVDQADGFLTQDWGGMIMALRSSTSETTGGSPRERLRPYVDLNIRTSNPTRPWYHRLGGGGLDDNPLYSGGYYAAPSIWSANAALPAWNLHVLNDPDITPRENLVLFDLPRRAAPSEAAMLSIGYLRHADLTADSSDAPHPSQPGAAVGNSLASPFMPRDRAAVNRTSGTRTGNVYDASYLLNTALWDRYFFSTIPQNAGATFNPAADPLPNARLRFNAGTSPALADLQNQEANSGRDRAARHLLVDGAFNVNSTSVESWSAVLSGLSGLNVNGETDLTGPFPRTLRQPAGSTDADDGVSAAAFAGFRNLSAAQVRQLATEIVNQIRARGPFLSLAQFVNRSLENTPLGLKGALQTAIDDAGLNAGFPAAQNLDSDNELIAYADPEASHGASGAGLPGWLTQADLLETLGPALSARSDTFVIRTYGESINPVTQEIESRVWCEAVVQRLPDYVKPAATSSAAGDPATVDPASLVNTENQTFGRRFHIVSFRWLTASDI
jgi:hypothetical protein